MARTKVACAAERPQGLKAGDERRESFKRASERLWCAMQDERYTLRAICEMIIAADELAQDGQVVQALAHLSLLELAARRLAEHLDDELKWHPNSRKEWRRDAPEAQKEEAA
ncbi:MAG: hypothetical protein HYY25_13375 [Candidatus Wallbacteria bacterium]|nr:hypothetical protein [Candidatus Wallbacteria bacterium]